MSAVITAVCGSIRIQAHRYADSLPVAEEALRLDPHYANIYSNVAHAMEAEGRYPEAIDALAKQADVSDDALAAMVAPKERCLGSLEKAVSERSETVTGIKVEPQFDLIRDDPRYSALVIKFGFANNDEQACDFKQKERPSVQ